MTPSTISGINHLSDEEKRQIYLRLIPPRLLERFHIDETLLDAEGRDLVVLNCPAGNSTAELALFHEYGFQDPVLYGHITDTINGQLHVLLYVLNDPSSPRFDIDCLPDGTPTRFGTESRNLEAEQAAMEAGLAPGQVRRGLRLLGSAIEAFDRFVAGLGHDLYFIEPLHYHNAIVFERYGFAYEKGRRQMEYIQKGFAPGGELLTRLDGSSPFRRVETAQSIRLRSWAIHDGILGEPFNDVTMYKRIGKPADIDTCPGCNW